VTTLSFDPFITFDFRMQEHKRFTLEINKRGSVRMAMAG